MKKQPEGSRSGSPHHRHTAVLLGRCFGNSAQFWLDLQSQHEAPFSSSGWVGEITWRARRKREEAQSGPPYLPTKYTGTKGGTNNVQ